MPRPDQQPMKDSLRLLLLTQAAVWLCVRLAGVGRGIESRDASGAPRSYTAYAHVFMDVRRKDYGVMLAHHIVTLALVNGGYALNYLRIGVIVSERVGVGVPPCPPRSHRAGRNAGALYP